MKFLPKPLTQKIAAHSLALSGALVLPMLAQGAEFDIRSQSLDKALAQLSSQADMPIVAAQKLLSGKNAQAVSGEMTVEQALERMLQGSNLTYSKTDSGQIVITSFATQGESDGENPDRSKEAGGEADEEVVITGSRLIKEPHQLTRQITVFDRAEIERSGITRLDEFLRRLPQNVNSPSNIGSGFNDVGDFGLGSNVFAGSSVNLRGLGSQYTLILIDGRRPPKGGQFGGITDISNIPVDRVERVEILFDGAAAVYGADAVGGVINIITNRDYQGTSVSLAASGTEEGGGSRLNFSVGHTFNWDGGGLTTTFSYQSQNAIDGSQRVLGLEETTVFGLQPSDPGNVSAPTSFFTGQPEGALFWVNDATNERLSGGVEVDVQDFFGIRREVVDRANPMPSFGATIVPGQEPIDPRTLGFRAVTFAQLPEFSGQPLTLDDISTSDELGSSTFVPFQGNSISPEDKTYSVGISLNQNLTDSLQMNLSL
ncbi:MAG: TonB-dependent receptor, partial [Porticoccaceae bacterium]|nr:TonB-dependent receptor [Porticoccaceae bacterium]